jgi:hypothetical protein
MIKSLIVGIKQASANWKLILLLLAIYLLVSLPLAAPVFVLILQTSSGTAAAERLLADKLDVAWLIDLINEQLTGLSIATLGAQLGLMLLVIGSAYLLLNTFFAGGILEILTSEDRPFTMQKFFAGCGAYFWRFFRLMLVSLIFYGIAIGLYLLVRWPLTKADDRATVELPIVIKQYALGLLLLLLLALVNMIFDYAKIGTVIHDRRKMFRETFKALRFAFRRFAITYPLYLVIALTGLILFFVLTWLRGVIPQSSFITVLLATALGQLALASRLWTRLVFYGAEADLYQRLNPPPLSAESAAMPELETPPEIASGEWEPSAPG